jgi:hypothetical protein
MVPMRRGIISLDHIHCNKDGEIGSAEPYLLTAFFKVDGNGNYINLDTSEPPLFIDGFCTFQGTPGTHGNLGDTAVSDGDDVPIPPALGEFQFALEPITAAGLTHPERSVGGFVGVVVALMEQNALSDSGAAAGHAAFDRTLENQINKTVPTIRSTEDRLEPAQKEQIRKELEARIKAAIIDAELNLLDFQNLFNPDRLIGADVFFTNKSTDVRAGLQRTLPNSEFITHDYELFGSIIVAIPLQITGVTADGGMWHAIRDSNGTWDGFGDVKDQAGAHPGAFTSVACAGIDDELHVCGVTSDGGIWHAIREPRRWIGFGDVKGQAGAHPGTFTSVACAGIGGELHVCGVTSDGGIWHAIRRADGSWVGFGDVKSQAGAHPGGFTSVACAEIGGELHVCGATTDGRIWHTIRHATSWDGFGDVKSQTPGSDPGAFTTVACAAFDQDLHVCGTTTDGGMWHTIRHATSWDGFGDVKIPAGHHPGAFIGVGCGHA